jgi:hypothetical protein
MEGYLLGSEISFFHAYSVPARRLHGTTEEVSATAQWHGLCFLGGKSEERMADFQVPNTQRLLAEKEKVRNEMEVVISRGEELLERAHRLAESIEEQVRQALSVRAEGSSTSSPPSPIPDRSDK